MLDGPIGPPPLGFGRHSSLQRDSDALEAQPHEYGGFTSTPVDFVSNYTVSGTQADSFFAMDFDATATALFAIQAATSDIFTLDPATGVEATTGVSMTRAPFVNGLTASVDGSTWTCARPVVRPAPSALQSTGTRSPSRWAPSQVHSVSPGTSRSGPATSLAEWLPATSRTA